MTQTEGGTYNTFLPEHKYTSTGFHSPTTYTYISSRLSSDDHYPRQLQVEGDRLSHATISSIEVIMGDASSWLRGQRKYELVDLAEEAGLTKYVSLIKRASFSRIED